MARDKFEFMYQPTNISEMVLHPDTRKRLEGVLSDIPNIILTGSPGIGKGTFVDIIRKTTGYNSLKINGSDDRGIDVYRSKIRPFCTVPPLDGGLNLCYINEGDAITSSVQDALRDFIESVQDITRFVICCNYIDKITPELKSRFRVIQFLNPPGKEILTHCEYILNKEGIRYKKETLVTLIKKCYPDIRQTVISLQENIRNGVLSDALTITTLSDSYQTILEYMLKSDLDNIRKELRSNSIDYTALYRFLYDRLMDSKEQVFTNDAGAIILIAEHAYRDSNCGISELNYIQMVCKMMAEGIIS